MSGKITRRKSPLIQKLMNEITPQERAKTFVRMSVAARLDDMIAAKGWNHQEFASKLGVSQTEIRNWLSGNHNFTVDTLTEVSIVLELELAELLKPTV